MTTESQTTTYNGWTNYETWAANLWLTNEESSYRYWNAAADDNLRRARTYPHSVWTVSEDARFGLADMLKDEIEDGAPELDGTMYGDLLRAALSEVDWAEIAGSFLADRDGYDAQESSR